MTLYKIQDSNYALGDKVNWFTNALIPNLIGTIKEIIEYEEETLFWVEKLLSEDCFPICIPKSQLLLVNSFPTTDDNNQCY